MRQVDPRLALIRHALAPDAEPPRVSPLKRVASRAMKLPEVSAEVREQYEYEVTEREGVLMDSGLPEWCGSKMYHGGECCARHVVLGDLSCAEFYDYAVELPFVRGMVRVSTPVPVGLCTRCESVGHVVARCPFSVGDVDVMKVARLRRERRAGREAAA
jgi:hypothetical protein